MPGGTATAAVATVAQQQSQQQQQQDVPPTSSSNQSDNDQVRFVNTPQSLHIVTYMMLTQLACLSLIALPNILQVQNLALRCASTPRAAAVKTEYPDRKDSSKILFVYYHVKVQCQAWCILHHVVTDFSVLPMSLSLSFSLAQVHSLLANSRSSSSSFLLQHSRSTAANFPLLLPLRLPPSPHHPLLPLPRFRCLSYCFLHPGSHLLPR